MSDNRIKQLQPLQTVIGAINLNIKGRMQTFNVLYSGAMLPWVDGKMLFVPEKRYNDMLRDFFVNEGREYIIPSVTQIAQDRADVINAYAEGRLGGLNVTQQEEPEQEQIEEETADEIQENASVQEDELEAEDEIAEDEEQETPDESEEYEESESENEEVIEEENDSEETDTSEETESEEAYDQAKSDDSENESEIVAEEIDDSDSLSFATGGNQKENNGAESNIDDEVEASIDELKDFMVDNTADDTAQYEKRIVDYSFNDESINDLKEIISDQNKIMTHQNEIIMNLNDAVVKQQEAIETFKSKINNANAYAKKNQRKTYIAMILCLIITIATVVGMQLYAPKMESAIQLDPNTDAEVHIVIHNDDGTDSFERIGTITITDGKLTVGE